MRIIPRGTWGMPGPLGPARVRLPARRLYVHHSVTPARDGFAAVRQVARIGVARFGRASYSWAITPDGSVYEMQAGWIGAHTGGQNSTTLGVVAVGDFHTPPPIGSDPTPQLAAAIGDLHRHLIAIGMLVPDAPLVAHRDAPGAATACCGDRLVALLPDIRAGQTPTPAPAIPEAAMRDGSIHQRDSDRSVWLLWAGRRWHLRDEHELTAARRAGAAMHSDKPIPTPAALINAIPLGHTLDAVRVPA